MATTQNYTIFAGDSEALAMSLTGYDGVSAINLATATQIDVYFKRVLADPDSVARIAKQLAITVLSITGSPNGGTWTATIGGQTTAAIAYNAAASDVKTALELLSTVGAGRSYVFGGPGPGAPWSIVLLGTAAGQAITVNGASLTGGSTPALTASASGTITIQDAGNGKISVPLVPADTRGVQAQLVLEYTAKAFLADGSEITGGRGSLTITATDVQTT